MSKAGQTIKKKGQPRQCNSVLKRREIKPQGQGILEIIPSADSNIPKSSGETFLQIYPIYEPEKRE